MDKKRCTSCGETPKCACKNKDFTKAVVEIDNPGCITLMHKVTIPASLGDDTAVPPAIGKYKNVLLYYEANHKSYLYSSDGIPTLLANGLTDYEEAVNLPEINGITLIGNKTAADLGLQEEIANVEQFARFFDTVSDMVASTDLANGDYAKTLGYYAVGDGGGALYKIRTTAPSGHYETLNSGLHAELILDEQATPEQFGAYGDGTHDDSTAIQNAINAGRPLVFSPKTYLCFSLAVSSRTILHGNGATLKRPQLNVAPYNKTVAQMKWIRTITVEDDCDIDGFTFDNNCFTMWQVSDGYAQEQSASVVVQNASKKIKFNIQDCKFKNSAGDGLHIVQNVIADISNCSSEDCFRGGFVSSGYGSEINLDGWDSRVITTGVNDGIDLEVDTQSTIDATTYNANINNLILDYDLDVNVPLNGQVNLSNITMRPFSQDTIHGFLFGCTGGQLNISNSVLRGGLLGTSQTFISKDGKIYIDNCKIIGNTSEAIFKITEYQETTLGNKLVVSNSNIEGYQLFAVAQFHGDITFNGNNVTCTKINTGLSNITCNPANLFLINNNIVLSGTDSLDATVFGANQYTPSGHGRYHLYGNTFSGNPNAILYCSGDPLIYFDNTPYDALFIMRKSAGSQAKFYGNNRLILVPTSTVLTFPGFVAGEDVAIALDTGLKYRYTSGTTWTQI